MTLRQLINKLKLSPAWKSGWVFICYPWEVIRRMRERGEGVGADGELFLVKDLTEDQLNIEVKDNQWWFEDGDLCIDPERNW